MLKKSIVILTALVFAVVLCGCDLFAFNTDELLAPPALTGELEFIADAITESVDGSYTFKYPSRGNYRSAVIQEDINSDGLFEAFAFYSMVDGEKQTMHINGIVNREGEWVSVAQQQIVAGGVDKIDFCDLDGDGAKEILVGWEIYGTSEMQLAVYSMGKNALTQRMLQKYTHFTPCNLDEDEQNEVLLIKTGGLSPVNSAVLFSLSNDGITQISSCELDSNAKTFNEPIVSELSTGKSAVYIDEIKGVGAITEVLLMEKGNLINPLYNPDTKETSATLRAAYFTTTDIDGDGILEIPIQENVPSVTRNDVNEKLYLTNWSSFNGEKLTNQMTAMINIEDGYYYTIPSKLLGNIAILKSTDNRLREIYKYSPADMTVGEKLLYIKAVDKEDYDAGKYSAQGVKEIANDGETSFICSISDVGIQDGITFESVVSGFKIME